MNFKGKLFKQPLHIPYFIVYPDAAMNSSSIQTLPVRGTRMLNDFIRLAWTINASDPNWVPPLIVDVKEFLDPKKHPFYSYGRAEKFLAYQDGKPVGRILVSEIGRAHV